MNLHSKSLTDNDWKTLVDLEKIAGKSYYYHAITDIDELKKYFYNSKIYFASDKGKIVGYVAYEIISQSEAQITGLIVVPEKQGKGIGKQLIVKILQDLNSINKISVITHPENSAALCVYLKLGFKIKGWKENYYGKGQSRIKLEKKL